MDPLADILALGSIECGKEAAKHFTFAEGYTNLNNGSYGTCPTEVRAVYRHFQDKTDARPDAFIRYEYRTTLLDKSRETLARYLDVPVGNCVLVPNATTAFDTVLRNLVFTPVDVIICFATGYGSFENTAIYLTEITPVELKKVQYTCPVSDRYICDAFEATINSLRAKGKKPRIAIFDTINSLPGVRMPFEQLTEICKSYEILSCIDAAHCIGQLPIDLQKLDPDFFMSNCHKWLHVPRPCAVLYVPERNQHLLRATLPTGFGFVSLSKQAAFSSNNSSFITNFANVGTLDDNPYLCIEAALEWRKKLMWRGKSGEEAIMSYMRDLAQRGGRAVASILKTEVLDNEEGTLSDCSIVNIRLPLAVEQLTGGDLTKFEQIGQKIMKTMIVKHGYAVNVFLYAGIMWVRLCAQVYLTTQDFEQAGILLREICEKFRRGENL